LEFLDAWLLFTVLYLFASLLLLFFYDFIFDDYYSVGNMYAVSSSYIDGKKFYDLIPFYNVYI